MSRSFKDLYWYLPLLTLLLLTYPLSYALGLTPKEAVIMTMLLFLQNGAFTLVSRARQSGNTNLHRFMGWMSNGFYIFVFATMVAHYNNWWVRAWYILVTTEGSVFAHHLSLNNIEKVKSIAKDRVVTAGEVEQLASRLARVEEELGVKSKPPI